ncbi:MAG: hypothetical protein HQL72_04665 [Magnetococcales bacterium]|nr:hypothetical protein [Magnetococcales bacterium]
MKKRLSLVTFTAAFIGITSIASAECTVDYTRTACKGQEAISYKKCDGKQSCQKVKEADSLHACWQAALKSCNNGRLDITKYKKITATYNGQQLIGGHGPMGNPAKKGKNFCLNSRPDLNQCQ